MDIGQIEIVSMKAAMATGVDQVVLIHDDGGYAIQPHDAPVPKGSRVHGKFITGIDLLGIAGRPTISGFRR